jgi:ADP-ribose pyrophosphatase YjhB (NUDIX family)
MLVFNHNMYENIRTRAIILHQGSLLLLSPTQLDEYWCPPGGGLEPNESLYAVEHTGG